MIRFRINPLRLMPAFNPVVFASLLVIARLAVLVLLAALSATAPVAASTTASASPSASAPRAASNGTPGNPEVKVWMESVPASGKHEVLFTAKAWGRYSLRTSGEQPVSLAVSDKRTGVIANDGEPGQRHGRIDLFLDIGTYKLTVRGLKNASGNAQVTASPFSPAPGSAQSYLLPARDNRSELDDGREAGYWFEAGSDTTVYVEAVGRNLAELALWRDGEWLVPTHNRAFSAQPQAETPWSGLAFAAKVPKGLYRVCTYGGPGRPWSQGSDAHPLVVRGGWESLADNSTVTAALPAEGYAQWMLDTTIAEIVLEAPDKRRLTGTVERWSKELSPAGQIACDSIFAKSSAARTLLNLGSERSGRYRILRVTGSPGQTFTLRTFGLYRISWTGSTSVDWWVSSLHSGDYHDQIGATSVVVNQANGAIVAMQADTLSDRQTFARRFNLLDAVNTYVWVDGDGKYTVTPGGTAFKWRLGRFYYTRPPAYQERAWISGAKTLSLNAGLHLLEIVPDAKGVATLVMEKSSLLGGAIAAGKSALGAADNRSWNAPRPAVRFVSIHTGPTDYYTAFLNSQAPEFTGGAARPLPINPDIPLSVWCLAGEKIRVPIRLDGRRRLAVTDAAGKDVAFEMDGKSVDHPVTAGPGNFQVTLSGVSEPRCLLLSSRNPEVLPQGSPPAFPDTKRAAHARFTPLDAASVSSASSASSTTSGNRAEARPFYFDLDRNSDRPFAVTVTEPGLYRIETTGRLDTRITLADRFRHFSREAASNGVGRNAMLIDYLLPGQYQVTVATQGSTAGRLGLAAFRNALSEAGELEANIDNRKFVEAYAGAAYDLHIPTPGTYRIESLGQSGNFSIRLEDKEGWPFEPAVSDGAVRDGAKQLPLAKGAYRLISLPMPQDGRRIARLTAITDKKPIKGKGPHPLALNVPLASTWTESPGKKDSLPATFLFNLPAPITAKLNVSKGFHAQLQLVRQPTATSGNGNDSTLAVWSGTRKMEIPSGAYRILVRPDKAKNFAPYQVSVTTRDLIPGLSYDLHKPETFALRMGQAGIAEIGSQGMLDVAATLLDGDGKTVLASNDDGYLDWNFSIARALKAGRYFLRVEAAEENFTQTTVFLRTRADTLLDTLGMPSRTIEAGKSQTNRNTLACNFGRRLGVIPLSLDGGGDLIACAAQAQSPVGLSLEKNDSSSGEWRPVAQTGGISPSLSLPRQAGGLYRLKAWSENGVDDPVTVTCKVPQSVSADWATAQSGLSAQAEPLGRESKAWFKIDLGGQAPGHFRVQSSNPLTGEGAAVSTAIDSAFLGESGEWFTANQRYAWLEFRQETAGKFHAKLSTLRLESGKPQNFTLRANIPRVVALDSKPGSVTWITATSDGALPFLGLLREPTGREGANGEAASFAAAKDAAAKGTGGLRVAGLAVEPGLWAQGGDAAVVALPGDPARVALWNADASADAVQPSARLACQSLSLSDGGDLPAGISAWNASQPGARRWRLAKGAWRLHLTIPPQGTAVLRSAEGTRSLEMAPGDVTVEVDIPAMNGGELFLLAARADSRFEMSAFKWEAANGGASSGMSGATIGGGSGGEGLAPGHGLETQWSAAGAEWIALSEKPESFGNFYFRGSATGMEWLDPQGQLHLELPDGARVGPGGLIRLHHASGWAKADLCADRPDAAVGAAASIMTCKWGASLSPSGVGELSLASQVRLKDGENWFSFTLSDTQHVNLYAPSPLTAILLNGNAPVRYQEAWELFNWDLPLPPGRYTLGLRSIPGGSLAGSVLSGIHRPLESLSEAKPVQCYLGPGQSRLLAFNVGKVSEIGIGLRMNRETAEARLYDADGNVVAQGKQEFTKLPIGRYYLWVRVPEGAQGTDITARLFGQNPPPNEPPEKLVKWIVSGEAGPKPEPERGGEASEARSRPAWERFLRAENGDGEGAATGETAQENGGTEGGQAGVQDGEGGAAQGAGGQDAAAQDADAQNATVETAGDDGGQSPGGAGADGSSGSNGSTQGEGEGE